MYLQNYWNLPGRSLPFILTYLFVQLFTYIRVNSQMSVLYLGVWCYSVYCAQVVSILAPWYSSIWFLYPLGTLHYCEISFGYLHMSQDFASSSSAFLALALMSYVIKKPWFLWLKNNIRSQDLGSRYTCWHWALSPDTARECMCVSVSILSWTWIHTDTESKPLPWESC